MSQVRSRTGASLTGSGASVASFLGSPILSQIQVKATGLGFCAYGNSTKNFDLQLLSIIQYMRWLEPALLIAQPGCDSIYDQLFMQFHTL